MNAIFALALFVSPSWAGVVAPVENGVAPAGTSVGAVPVLSPTGGSLGMPSLGSAPDLRGSLPLLPAPVPGLVRPAMNFIGESQQAAAVNAEAGATQAAPATAKAQPGRAADRTPALPGKPSPGASSPAISLDRRSAAATLADGPSSSRTRADGAPENPLVDSSALEHSQPEKAAGIGRNFFDQSSDKARATLAPASASERPAPAVAATILEGGAFGPGYLAKTRLAPQDAGSAFGAGHGPSRTASPYAPEGETLHDAVASPLSGAMTPSGAVVKPYGAVAPNGDLAASAGSAALSFPGAPRQLALDLSRSGLVVRVRSALNGVLAPAQADIPLPKLASPGPSTALLERGAMLEAFSVAGDYAAHTAGEAVAGPLASGVSRAAGRFAPLSPVTESAPAPLWWALFALPLFVAAIRGIL